MCFLNKRDSITVGKTRLSQVLQAPGKPWGFGILHTALPTGKDNLLFPQITICWLPNWKEYLNGEIFYSLLDNHSKVYSEQSGQNSALTPPQAEGWTR